MSDPRIRVYSFSERILNDMHRMFGHDRELDELSNKVVSLKDQAFKDNRLDRSELDAIYTRMADIEAAYAKFAGDRGYPVGSLRPTTPASFKVYREQQEIHFQWLAGKDLQGGALAELNQAVRARDGGKVDQLAGKIAFDLLASSSPAVALDKVNLLRASLSKIDDRSRQAEILAKVGAKLDNEISKQWPVSGGKPPPLTRAAFDKAVRYEGAVSVHETKLPAEVRGTNKLFPNRPIPGWENTTLAATKASLDDLSRNGQLFLDKVPPGAGVANVAMKLDLNFGADGPPSVTDPTTTHATLLELLRRAKAQGKQIRFTVGDSSGGENIPLGRTSMDIMRDTGNYHYALKAGLTLAAEEGNAEAKTSLAKIVAAEQRGVFFGGKDDKTSTPVDLASAEKAAAKYVVPVDYDKAGYVKVDPKLGPIGLASWGTREFQIARPWAEADYRVHVARGASTHLLAGWTGATKGLIGLHAFGLRPVDQGMDKRGENPLAAFRGLTQITGFAAIFANRTGASELLAKVAASGDPKLIAEMKSCQAKWEGLQKNTAAWSTFSRETNAIADEAEKALKSGAPHPEVMERVRLRTREALDSADRAVPGFRQAFWDAAHAGTRFLFVAARNFRGLIPAEIKDADVGRRIGLLSQLPYQSDLVIQSQPKMGEGGGPDAYHEVRDVGVIIAGTNERDTDAAAWRAAGKRENLWELNYPVHSAVLFGRGPMHHDEIRRLDGP